MLTYSSTECPLAPSPRPPGCGSLLSSIIVLLVPTKFFDIPFKLDYVMVYDFEPPRDKTNKMTCAPSEISVQPGHRPSLCAQWVAKGPRFLHADTEDWSDWADAQADLSLHWSHISFCWFCHEAAHFNHAVICILVTSSQPEIHAILNFNAARSQAHISRQFRGPRRALWGRAGASTYLNLRYLSSPLKFRFIWK